MISTSIPTFIYFFIIIAKFHMAFSWAFCVVFDCIAKVLTVSKNVISLVIYSVLQKNRYYFVI